MATQDDVRTIALALPGVREFGDRFGFEVAGRGKAKPKSIAWVWLERLEPKKARVPQPAVLAVRVVDEFEKRQLIAADPSIYFTEAHYDNYPAVLVRLAEIDVDELAEIITDAWRTVAPKALIEELDQRSGD